MHKKTKLKWRWLEDQSMYVADIGVFRLWVWQDVPNKWCMTIDRRLPIGGGHMASCNAVGKTALGAQLFAERKLRNIVAVEERRLFRVGKAIW